LVLFIAPFAAVALRDLALQPQERVLEKSLEKIH
jgi:hypothetical protein